MTTIYVTTLYPDGWTCTCPSPFIPAQSERMTTRSAEINAENHVDYYMSKWPHEVQKGNR
jgi:hypothetical protein